MVNTAKRLGINHNTPFQDITNAFHAVWQKYGISDLGIREFWRVIKRVIKEAETLKSNSRISVE